MQLAIYHFHTLYSVLFFAVYLTINALFYQKWPYLSMIQKIEMPHGQAVSMRHLYRIFLLFLQRPMASIRVQRSCAASRR